MIEYIYIVKCPGYEDEMFNFFTDARMQCDLLMSKKPSITQVEVERNDFGECTDSHDLGTVWSWEEAMKDTEGGYTDAEPTKSIFTKDDLKLMADGQDPEFDNLDNSVDCEIDEISEKKPIEEDLLSSYEYTRMTKEELYDRLVNKFEDVEIDVGDLGITDVPFYDGGRYSNSALVAMFEDDVFYVTMWHYSDDGEETESGSYDFETDSFEELWDELMSYKPEALVECSERKPIPEGMTIEQLVEEMEENEDTVECTWCNDLFDKSECRYEVGAGGPDDGLGWLCSRCEMAIKSRGETLTFRENNYWDFLDEAAAIQDSTMIGKYVRLIYNNSKYQAAGSPLSMTGLKSLLKSDKSCKLDNNGINLIAKFDNRCKVIQETNNGYLVKVPCYYRDRQDHSKFEERPRYIECWIPKASAEIIKEGLNEEITAEISFEELVKDSIKHLVNDLGRDSTVEDFVDDVILDIERNYDNFVPEDPMNHSKWASAIACEVSRQLNNPIEEDLETKTWICAFEGNEIGTIEAATEEEAGEKMQRKYPEYPYGLYDGCFEVYPADEEELTEATELHDLGNEYDGGYPAETPEVSDSHLKLCPECGKETFDIETGICVDCGFN